MMPRGFVVFPIPNSLLSLAIVGLILPAATAMAVDQVVTFPDPGLESAIRDALGKPTGDILASEAATLTYLVADGRGMVA